MNKMQQKNFRHMVKLGMPKEWAWLIAERSDADISRIQSMPTALCLAFDWEDSKEGGEFWLGVDSALIFEERHERH